MLHKYCSRNVELCIIIYIISLIEGIILYILEIVHHGFIYPQFGGLGEANGTVGRFVESWE